VNTHDGFHGVYRQPSFSGIFVTILILSGIMEDRDAKSSIGIDCKIMIVSISNMSQTIRELAKEKSKMTYCLDATLE
jgi:hypothetical protein